MLPNKTIKETHNYRKSAQKLNLLIMDSQEQETVYQGSLEIIGCTHLKVIVLCVDLITINISIIIIILIGTRMIVMMSIVGARRTVRLAANTGRSHRSGRCPTHNDR